MKRQVRFFGVFLAILLSSQAAFGFSIFGVKIPTIRFPTITIPPIQLPFLPPIVIPPITIPPLFPPSTPAGYTQTKYPIVLVHGHLGGDNLLVIKYFYGIPEDLARTGATVYTPTLSGVNSSTVRGEQLVSYLKKLQAQYGYTKFNLIGHSQGGIDSRYAAAKMSGAIASVTTVGSPNTGAFPSDWGLSHPGLSAIGGWFLDLFGKLNGYANTGQVLPQDYKGFLNSSSSDGMRAFNQQYPAGMPTSPCGNGPEQLNGVYYYSAGGTSKLTNILDPSDYFLGVQSLESNLASDGWIDRCSTHFGQVLNDSFEWNHLDEVNQMIGLVGLFKDPVAFYRTHAARLKSKGL